MFISRPIPELFDAVDPTADTGGGKADYALMLECEYYFRLAGRDSRKDVDYKRNSSNERLKWQPHKAGETVTWKPVALKKQTGRTDAVATFDVAVVIPPKVVVFRNQNIYPGESRAEVREQAKDYVTKVLGLPVQDVDEIVNVSKPGDQYAGVLIYSFLADQCKARNAGGTDVEIVDQGDFTKLRMDDDKPLMP